MQKSSLPVGSKLLVLNPVLDDDGLIRSNSRLVNADILPYDARYPVTLPRKHAVTRLIVKFEHEEGLHASGTQILDHICSRSNSRMGKYAHDL